MIAATSPVHWFFVISFSFNSCVVEQTIDFTRCYFLSGFLLVCDAPFPQGTGAVFDRHFVSRHANGTHLSSASSTSESIVRAGNGGETSVQEQPPGHSSEADSTNVNMANPSVAPPANGGGNTAADATATAAALPPVPEGCNIRTGKKCKLPDGEHFSTLVDLADVLVYSFILYLSLRIYLVLDGIIRFNRKRIDAVVLFYS